MKMVREYLKDFAAFLVGSVLYAISITAFTAANDIAPGGFSGLAIIISHLTKFPIGIIIIVLNIPLFLLGTKRIGLRFLTKTIVATVIMSVAIDLFELFIPAYTGNKILASLSGGVLAGAGLSLVLLRGGTTGGTDIAAKLLRQKFPFIPLGRMIMLLDVVIIVLAATVFRNLETALYSTIVIFTTGRIIDNVLYGADRGKVLFVVSDQHKLISQKILESLGRGVTLLNGSGAYTSKQSTVLMCAVRQHEVAKLHEIIKNSDPGAFVIVTEAGEILGSGFKAYGEK